MFVCIFLHNLLEEELWLSIAREAFLRAKKYKHITGNLTAKGNKKIETKMSGRIVKKRFKDHLRMYDAL